MLFIKTILNRFKKDMWFFDISISALSVLNLKQIYRIIKNTKIKKEDFCFSLCTPVIISKTTDDGTDYRQRYFRTKAVRAASKQSIISTIKASKFKG